MEQFIFLLIIGAISLIQWLVQKSREARENAERQKEAEETEVYRPKPAPQWNAPRPIATPLPGRGMDEAARRLREALGLPPEADDAPAEAPPRPARVRPPVILEERVLEPEEIAEFGSFEHRSFAPPPVPVSAPLPVPSPILMPDGPAEPKSSARSAVNELLRSREGLRRAILAQEILGPPKGLVF